MLEISLFSFILGKKCINIYLKRSNDDVVSAFTVFGAWYEQLLFAIISPGEYVANFFNRKAVILTCVDLAYLLFVEGRDELGFLKLFCAAKAELAFVVIAP